MSQLADCLQLSYHRTVRDQILLLYSREILILDLTIKQTVGIISLDRAVSPLTQVIFFSALSEFLLFLLSKAKHDSQWNKNKTKWSPGEVYLTRNDLINSL